MQEHFAKVFISADKPLEVRRKKTLDRLEVKSMKQNKSFSVRPVVSHSGVQGNILAGPPNDSGNEIYALFM